LVGLPLDKGIIRGLNIQKNKLTFKDVLPNIGFSRTTTFNYAPQDSIYKDTVFSINKGSSLTLNLGIDDTVTTNVYKWYRNDLFFRETTTNKLSLGNVQDSLTGIYTCVVTNSYAPNLSLYSRKIKVKLNCVASQPSLSGLKQICLGNNTTLTIVPNTYSNYQWSTGNTVSSITLTPSVSQAIYVTVTDTKGCTAKDSVLVEVNTIPKAQDDIYTFLFGQENIKMTVIQNDNVVKLGKIDLISQPLFGSINYIGNGLFDYTTTNSFQTDTFRYRVCDEICPQFCDTAKVTIKLPGSTSIGIRPDCSCDDETLKFGDISEYPELTVINRWGNTVFKAQPYRNDWNGVNQNNQPLPAATYYYVLRLEGKEGKVIKGDLTIIR
jgi:gliding motility-associated-like protein